MRTNSKHSVFCVHVCELIAFWCHCFIYYSAHNNTSDTVFGQLCRILFYIYTITVTIEFNARLKTDEQPNQFAARNLTKNNNKTTTKRKPTNSNRLISSPPVVYFILGSDSSPTDRYSIPCTVFDLQHQLLNANSFSQQHVVGSIHNLMCFIPCLVLST